MPDRGAPGLALWPLLVTTTRAFHRDETLSAYAEVTDVGAGARRDIELVTIASG